MSEVKVNKISPRIDCGTVQLGDSGDTITIPAGATIVNNGTQTGFGRTGTVDWDTTAKTASFTAVSGNGYFVNTTSGAITVTLPAGSAGDIVGISDYASTFQTNNVTITPNGTDKINGTNDNASLSTQGIAVSLVYVDATRGWKSVTGSDNDTTGASFIQATGGTITTCGNCKIHTFTGPGTFCVSSLAGCAANNEISYMVVAGGGGGGESAVGSGQQAGGGGAGGFREDKSPVTPYTASPLDGAGPITVTVTSFPIVVGGGGAGGSGPTGGPGVDGSNSIFSTITSTGGGGGGTGSNAGTGRQGAAGGSGGGSGASNSPSLPGGAGNTPPVSPPQGNPGGSSAITTGDGGSGGGATGAGDQSPSNGVLNPGGAGATTNISASPVAYSTGGANTACGPGNAGGANSGDGGNGGKGGSPGCGGAGGSGIVIIRYKYQ
jgi:hypothetical protein